MDRGIIISLCDYSAEMVRPWAEDGFHCYCIDVQHPAGRQTDGNITRIGASILDCTSTWFPFTRLVKIAFGFPPCTHTAVSGARHFQAKGAAKAAEAFALIARCEQLFKYWQCPYFIEQPVSTTSTYCGKPTHTFDPCDYGDPYRKKTCLWTGGGFKMPPTTPVEPIKVCEQGSWIQMLGGSSDRTKNLRSQTPPGFARAVYYANH